MISVRANPEQDAVVSKATAVRTVLVAEDDDSVRETLKRVLERHGYCVVAVPDGEAAWRMLRDSRVGVDLVVLDLIMPRVGGRALLEMAKRLTGGPRFLVISGWTAQLGVERPRGIGDHPFLPKPWTTSEFLDAVRTALTN